MAKEPSHSTKLAPEEVESIRAWHERAYASLAGREGDETQSYLGLDLVIPPDVFPPTPTSDMLGKAVEAEVRAGERVLDMGTGAGANALLAARAGAEVLAVDINPSAVATARANAERNGLGESVEVRQSDVYAAVDGDFDVMIFDPPFRWFAARDALEAAITDEGYAALGRFFEGAAERLREGGRLLVFFGNSGDIEYLLGLSERAGFERQELATRRLELNGQVVDYFVWRFRAQSET